MEKQQLCHLNHSQKERPADSQKKLITFLDVQLRAEAKFSVGDEYPALFGEYPGGESLFIEQGQEIVSHAGFLVREYQNDSLRMKVGIIGSVVTAPTHRGKGMASTLVSAAIAHLKARGAILGVLWGDASDFYGPLGFHRGGREIDFVFTAENVPVVDGPPMEYDRKKHAAATWRLYQQHTAKLDRSLEEHKRLFDVPQAKIYVTEKDGAVTSYLVINKGADFKDFIHEWAGDVHELQKNVARVQRKIYPTTSLTLIAPAFYPLTLIEQIASDKREGVLGLLRVIDRQGLILTYLKHLTQLGLNHRWDKASSILHCEGAVYSLQTDGDVLELIFSGNQSGMPALPFFLWGFDSI